MTQHPVLARRPRRLAILLVFGAASPLVAQDATLDVSPVHASLAGSWEGTGTLMGRGAAFRMTWSPLVDGFTRLSFSNAWVDDAGVRTPVLSAEAVYLVAGPTAEGAWIDTRPAHIRLEAIVSDTSIVTTWTAESERGRTEYVVRGPDDVLVRDYVEVDGALRAFGEAVYRRADQSLR